MRKLSGLDHLRGLAILLVLLYHLYQSFFRGYAQFDAEGVLRFPDSHPLWVHWMNELHVGVNLFFVISGFLMHHLYGERTTTLRDVFRFLEKRFLRIAPPYWVAIGCSVLGGLLLSKAFDPTGTWWHLLFIHNLSDYYSYSIQAVFWSIAVEIQFYLIFAVLLLIKPADSRVFWLLIFVVSLIVSFYFRVNLENTFRDYEVVRWKAMDHTLIRFPEFLMGVLASKFCVQLAADKRFYPLLALAIFLLSGAFLGHSLFFWNYYSADLLYSGAFALLLVVFAAKTMKENLISFTGKISYTMYLYHFLIYSVWDTVMCRIFNVERVASWSRLPIFVSGIVVVYLASFFLYRMIEKPSLNLKNLILSKSDVKG